MWKITSINSCLIMLLENISFYLFSIHNCYSLCWTKQLCLVKKRGRIMLVLSFLLRHPHLSTLWTHCLPDGQSNASAGCWGRHRSARAVGVPRARAKPMPGQEKIEIVCCDTRLGLAAWVTACSPKHLLGFLQDYEFFSINSDVVESCGAYCPLLGGPVL